MSIPRPVRRWPASGPLTRSAWRATAVAMMAGSSLAMVLFPAGADQVIGASIHRADPVGSRVAGAVAPALPAPHAVAPFANAVHPGEGVWHPVGRLVSGHRAVYSTLMGLPDSPTTMVGVAWMDTKLLRARLYSGSLSPGGVSWKYSAPVTPVAATKLVAAFNGGFLLKDSNGGYLSEGRLVAPLRAGAASLVIYKNGSATIGQWGRDVGLSANVVAVRQNLSLLVDHARPAPGINPNDTLAWGKSLYQNANAWRSALGVTANGAFVYVVGPMSIIDLAVLLVRAGALRAMELDMNPLWPVFATYDPSSPRGQATPANGTDLLATLIQTPARFFQPTYTRDFVTMSAP